MQFDEDDEEFCHCEDPYAPGKKLLLCGHAICLRLLGQLPRPTIVAWSVEEPSDDT